MLSYRYAFSRSCKIKSVFLLMTKSHLLPLLLPLVDITLDLSYYSKYKTKTQNITNIFSITVLLCMAGFNCGPNYH